MLVASFLFLYLTNSIHSTLNRLKLERAVTFIKYLARGVSLIFPRKTLKITYPAHIGRL